MKKKILFLCTGNSCRSQMAEGWCRHLYPDDFEAFSAGTKKHGMNPYAIKVMKEEGVDISSHTSKTIDQLPAIDFDYVVTVCENAKENCPYLSGGLNFHKGFDDPPELTREMADEEDILTVYRRVRDEIKNFISGLKDLE